VASATDTLQFYCYFWIMTRLWIHNCKYKHHRH